MKTARILVAVLCLPALLFAQLPYQESFETTTGYTQSSPFGCTNLPNCTDFFNRFNLGNASNWASPVSGYQGTWYVGVEDHDEVTGNAEDWIATNDISISGETNIKVKIKVGATSLANFEGGDYLFVEYQLDNSGTWVVIGRFGGMTGSSPFFHDVLLNGITGNGDDVQMGANMSDIEYDLNTISGSTVSGTTLKVRVRFSLAGPQEEVQFDDIRVEAGCNFNSLTVGTQSPCANNLYNQDVVVNFSNAPATGTLNVNGQSFAIASSPQTVTLTGLIADGLSVDVTAAFSAVPGCTLTETALFTAPAACPAPTCTGTSLATGAAANTNVFGIAWDVNSKCNPVTIKDIQVTTIPSGATVNILTRAGTYVGHEDLITGWTIVGAFVAGTNSYLTGGTMNVQIPANSTQAFALALNQASFLGGAGVACEVNPAAPAIVASNVDLEYTKGIYTTSPLIPTAPNAIFAGAMCYDVTPTPSFNLAFNMYDLNYPFANGATDPNTFYYGVTWAKRMRVLVSGGVGPFTYSWSNSQGYNTIAAHVPNQRYLQTPAGPSDMICEVTDLGTGCTETGFITVGWSDEFWCGSSNPNMYQMIKMCQGGATICMNGQQAKAALLAGTASLGECPATPKREDANEDSFIVYPNPTTGFTTMHYNASENTTATALIIDLNGRIISSDEIYLSRGITEYGFDLSSLTNGMYFVQLRTQNSVETQKIQVLK